MSDFNIVQYLINLLRLSNDISSESIDDSLENIEHLSEEINKKNRIELIYGDLNDLASLITTVDKSKPDYVFHLAAQSYPQTSFDAPIYSCIGAM